MFRTGLAVVMLLVTGLLSPRAAPDGPELRGAVSDEDRRRFDEAIDVFADAGLGLPDVEVRFHDRDDGCRGNFGYFTPDADRWRIDVCSDLGFVVVHEFAHAWVAENVDRPTRAAFLELRGLDVWSGDVPWNERGVEDSAFVIQQVLENRPARLSNEWRSRLAAYELLVGRPAPVRPSA